MIGITLIGTGALLPIPNRALSSMFLTCGGHSILFDCGEGTQTAARKAGISLMKTDMIATTHYHGDHIFGIPGLLQTMYSAGRVEPIYIAGPEGLNDILRPMMELIGGLGFEVLPVEIPHEGVRLREIIPGWPNGAMLSSFPAQHRCIAQGYSFTLSRAGKFDPVRAQELGVPVHMWKVLQRGESVFVGGREVLPAEVIGDERRGLKVAFTGDSAMCESVVDGAKGADLLICEATYGKDSEAGKAIARGHMTFSHAAETAKLAGVKTLWLTHYSQSVTDPAEYLPNAQAIFPETVCGYDGMSAELCFES